eukprot:3906649-Pleurochrysis_carterae.AAC.1
MHVMKLIAGSHGCRGCPFPIRARGGSCGTIPFRAASTVASAARGGLGATIRYASAPASPLRSGVYM